MTEEMSKELWERKLKPWSEKWWKFYDDFTDFIRQHKLRRPPDDCNITEKLAKELAEEFRKKRGPVHVDTEQESCKASPA